MSEKLSDYLVLEILPCGNFGETRYKVRHKRTDSLFIWKAYDCKKYSTTKIESISHELKLIKSLKHENIIQYAETIVHSLSNTLYIVTELHPEESLSELVAKCKIESIHFEECFIWSLIYQIASVSKSISELNINILKQKIKMSNIYVTPKFQIKVDAFYLKTTRETTEDKCLSGLCEIGSIIYEVCTLNKYENRNKEIKFPYGEDLQNIVNILLHDENRQNTCNLKPDTILRHPTVLLNLVTELKNIYVQSFVNSDVPSTPTSNNDSAFESDESVPKITLSFNKSISLENVNITLSKSIISEPANFLENKPIVGNNSKPFLNGPLSPTLIALDLKMPGYVPPKVSDHVLKWRSRLELCREPEEVSENALNNVWLERLAALKNREEAVRLKEQEINRKKVFDEVASKINSNLQIEKCEPQKNIIKDVSKSMSGITIQTAMAQKGFDDNQVQPYLKDETIFNGKFKPRMSVSDGSEKSHSTVSRRTHRRSSSVRTRYRKKKPLNYEDLNSSLSADQGDTSMLPTSTKISSDIIPRPKSIHNLSRRKVHFNSKNNPFAEYDSISSTMLTFFEIEKFDANYEIPKSVPPPRESIAERIAKFTYLDLEAMTNKKRAMMEEFRKTPPKINRSTKPTLKSRVKAAENAKKSILNHNIHKNERDYLEHNYNLQKHLNLSRPPSATSRMSGCSSHSGSSYKSISSLASVPKDERRKTIAPIMVDIDFENDIQCLEKNKENAPTPLPKLKKDSKRKSILGFKTPFKFRL